ncbi:hypothetical protein M8C21_020169 [Ambrosia artemisiifolia]|uniref:Protein kinase domain-containing protein n=1 Tax=Ambrosia artemisiifolia TaxID=4212 RepID=A0AAD5BS32_AMBAR|nr:hypothetical protein M8C21_020169 [Ambrosia artemisiifolia]
MHGLPCSNLIGNNFTKPLPAQLLAKQKKGTLLLSIEESSDEDKSSCQEGSCGNNKHKKARFLVVTIAIGLSVVVLLSLVIIWLVKRRKKALIKRDESFIHRKQQFTYSEVVGITNNFQKEIGRGGFGGVFHGIYEDKQVAVKMLSESSSQGYKEFQAEVKLLMLIHRNITSLIGYCNDGEHKAIIYEFMANGNLEKHLYDGHPNVLSWERRLQIGCDAAEEGDWAPRAQSRFNRYLNEIHPGYYSTRRLTEKSDVYSFGVVLLELITGRKATLYGEHIVNWVKSPIENGNVETIIDSRIVGGFDINTVRKVVEMAMACVSSSSIERPTLDNVVVDLKNCLRAERERKSKLVSCNMDSVSGPTPR